MFAPIHRLTPFLLTLAATLPSVAQAQLTITEPPDRSNSTGAPTSIGTLGLGDNTLTGALSAVMTNGFPPSAQGDPIDAVSFTVPAGMVVTLVDLTITNFAGTSAGQPPNVQFVDPPSWVQCATSGTTAAAIPTATGMFGPGTYTIAVHLGLTFADHSAGSTRSFNYALRVRAIAETGACCNGWTGDCAIMTPAACSAVGLRYDGLDSVCSPATCAVPPPACPADFNNSGIISVQDIFDFLAAYFAGCP